MHVGTPKKEWYGIWGVLQPRKVVGAKMKGRVSKRQLPALWQEMRPGLAPERVLKKSGELLVDESGEL
jgi:hypothetical protein